MDTRFIHIQFDKKKFDAILCLDTILPPEEFFRQFPGIPVLASDGAAIRLINMGIIPDYIVGDLDTFYNHQISDDIKNKTKIIYEPEQDTNDFEKTLKIAFSKNLTTILILGIHGGELEHTLNNWSVLMRYGKEMNLCIYDENRYGIPIFNSFSLNLLNREMVSLIPQSHATITTRGLKWELNNEKLEMGIREGARNIAVKGEIIVNLHEGSLLLFIDSRIPNAPELIE